MQCLPNYSDNYSYTQNGCSAIRVYETISKFIMLGIELNNANKNLVSVYNKFSRFNPSNFSLLRGHIFEGWHASTFNMNAIFKNNPYRAFVTSLNPKCSTHTVDILVTKKNITTNFKDTLNKTLKNFTVQLKAGKTSPKTIKSDKYKGMQKITEIPCKEANQTIKMNNVTSTPITTEKLTQVTQALCEGKKVSVINKSTFIWEVCTKSIFSKKIVLLVLGESIIRNFYNFCIGKKSAFDFGKEVVYDLCFINDAKRVKKIFWKD